MKGVSSAELGDGKILISPRLRDYSIFTEELTDIDDLAAKTFGTGVSSPVYKELAAFEPLVAKIRQVRLNEMRMKEIMYKDIAVAFDGMSPKKATYQD
ncbi:hypothetical protein CGRA01v4_14276 [Colletotrichum graminicola]|nr:hypothetical protein CGRA01v4_14276 [Colletotrichum graminicola]